ncbi:MAG: flagellar hook-associated protein FlgL [Sulfuricella sp.]|nr:flagellar hook-associated protein FlgL [Sulfuricella sp.]
MRISTSSIYDLGVASIQQQQFDWVKTQQQVSTGRRMVSPSDDPVASAQVLDVTQFSELNKQHAVNGTSAMSSLETEEGILGSITSLIQDVRVLAIYAGDAALSNADRASQAMELRGRFDELLGLANSTDGTGNFMFAGYKGTTTPFSEGPPGTVTYNGDQGQRLATISPARQIAISDSGSDLFQRIKNGNGTFVTAPGTTNTGTGIVSPGAVVDLTKWNAAANNKDFTIKFAVSAAVPPVTTYDIVDNVSGLSRLTGLAPAVAPYPRTYTDGSVIGLKSQGAEPAFDFGAEFSIGGTPANGDTFTVKASTNQDLFKTLNDLITTLQSPVNTVADRAKLGNGLNTAMSNLDLALDNVLTIYASVGSRLKEIDAVQSAGEDLSLQYQQTISQLQDVDYAKAISDLTRQQTSLDAAMKSYMMLQGLSLFDMM